jgi:hypothetical protein
VSLQEGAPAAGAAERAVRVPEFFVVGHQKCGTTALHEMLKAHPQVFLPAVKEPRYFAFDLRSSVSEDAPKSRPRTLDGYLALFAAARPEQRLGEVSPQYLRSRVAAGEIARVQPDARIIALLREPASFLRSFHMQMVSSNVETQRDLRKALALEPSRRAGKRLPRHCHHPEALMYSEHVRYVEQLRRFHEHFPAEHVLVLSYEQFRADNEATVRALLRFLDLDERADLPAVETSPLRAVRSPTLHRLRGGLRRALRSTPAAGVRAQSLGARWRQAAYAAPRAPDERLMLELRRRFRPEVEAISEYLDRDLLGEWGYDTID